MDDNRSMGEIEIDGNKEQEEAKWSGDEKRGEEQGGRSSDRA